MSTLDARKNFSITTVSQGYSAAALSIVVTDGSRFPDPATAGAFNLVWWNSLLYANPSDDPNVEVVQCTARSSNTLTILRAQEGTSASAKNTVAGIYKIALGVTAKVIDDIETALDTHTTNIATNASSIATVSAGLATHIADTANPHNVTKSQVGLGNVTNDAQIPLAQKAAPSGVASLDGSGKVPTSQLPALALTDVYVVASQVAQLALTAEEGDVAIRTDLNKSYIHNGGTAGNMTDWSELLTPTDAVLSVNGQTGAVTLTTSNITEGSNLYYTDERAQDAVGAMVDTTLVYTDGTPLLSRAALTGAITASAGSNTTALGSFTKAQLDAAVSDGNVLYVGDVTQYTDEMAQDAVGAMVSGDGSLSYVDATPSLKINLAHSNTFTINQGIDFVSDISSETTAFQMMFDRSVALVSDEYGFATIYAGITDSSNISGTIEDKLVQKSGFEVRVFRTGESTVNWIDGFESVRGYTSYVSYATEISGSNHDAEIVGHDITVVHSAAFSNDGTHLHTIYGNRIALISTSFISVDSFTTRKLYGEHIAVSSASSGDLTEVYGLYIESAEGGNVNYAIYSETTAVSHFAGDIEVPDEAYSASGWNGDVTVPTKNAVRDKIETMLSVTSVPASPVATGITNQVSFDSTYFYLCIATDTWKRVAWDATWIAASYLLMQNGDKFVFQNGDGFKLQDSL